ncbi:MAG: hypothetical protein JSR80_04420 [Verrucomicrobia bacterium]|nr:hypothetical protein [Verrucomicrobiota bacterium]
MSTKEADGTKIVYGAASSVETDGYFYRIIDIEDFLEAKMDWDNFMVANSRNESLSHPTKAP